MMTTRKDLNIRRADMKLTVTLPIYNKTHLEADLQRLLKAFSGTNIHLVGLFSKPTQDQLFPYAARSYAVSAQMLAQHKVETEALTTDCRRIFESLVLPAETTSEWREHEGASPEDIGQHALFSDILVLQGRKRSDGQMNQGFDYDAGLLSYLIMKAPISVLLMPEDEIATPIFTNPMLAWKMSPESASAAKAISRFLPAGSQLKLVTVTRQAVEGMGSWSASEISRYLQRLDLEIEEKIMVLQSGNVAKALEDFADSSQSSLIASGAFGRQRWLETLLGGVTRDLLANCRKPVLFAH